jgi:hypothetical protein
MFTRTITIQANPPQQIVLYFDSRSNAEKAGETNGVTKELRDDYDHVVRIRADLVMSDVLTNVSEAYRAQGEMEIKQMEAQLKFDERIKKLPTIEAFVNRKRAKAQMANMPRVAMPPGAA